ncbi:MAG: hypothetical protein SWK76_17785 [Actinomycetota bacterium]|nr:hypothetical protein [Actinomycetota bacterium]
MGPLGFSNPAMVQDILHQVGIGAQLDLTRVRYHLHAFGLETPMSLPCPEMIEELRLLFPVEEEGTGSFHTDMKRLSVHTTGPPR